MDIKHGDQSEWLRQRMLDAIETHHALCITGGGSKSFYGRYAEGEPVEITEHRGIVKYEPMELMLTARTGTTLHEIEQILDGQGQMLPFEPPCFKSSATLGGAIATGLSGPARPYRGAARDFILGIKCLTGRGEILSFGGEVMKNVAGFDASRLMAGAMGTLGILLEVTLKVLPKPAHEITLAYECPRDDALIKMNRWAGKPLPVTASLHDGERLYLRLSGTEAGIEAARRQLGGDIYPDGNRFWRDIREHRHGFYLTDEPLWRISVPPATPALGIDGNWLIDWGGAQRWLKTRKPIDDIRAVVASAGGHATVFRGGDRGGEVFHTLTAALYAIHKRLKSAFDPHGLLNPGRLYAGI